MRTFKVVSALVVLLVAVCMINAVLFGVYFERRYYDFARIYNLQGNIKLQVLKYDRGWFSSDVALAIEIAHPENINLIKVLNIEDNTLPKRYVIDQHIKHGPLIYVADKAFPIFIGLAAIKYRLQPSDELFKAFPKMREDNTILMGENLIALNGTYYTSVQLGKLDASNLNKVRDVRFDKLLGSIWVWNYPTEPHISGNIQLENVFFKKDDESILKEKLQMNFTQKNPGGTWYFKIDTK
jgi:hypothetical protein